MRVSETRILMFEPMFLGEFFQYPLGWLGLGYLTVGIPQ
jgi:hypothetical protein